MINTKSCKKIVLRKVIFMDKRLCILNPMDSGRKIECKTLQDKFNTVGGNPGNLMFYESVKKEGKR